MRRFVARRLAGLAVTLVLASFLVYGSMELAPGGAESVLYGGHIPSPQARAAIRAEYHLDDPFLLRYWRWLIGALHGDFGRSVVGRQPVSDRILAVYGVTAWLVVMAAVLVLVVGIGLGVLSAVRPGIVDTTVTVFSAISVGVPAFAASVLLIDVFALRLHWFPAFGEQPGVLGRLHSLVLPAVALAVLSTALVTRVTRAAVRRELEQGYVVTGEARALSKRRLIVRHVLRNAATPILTIGGLQVAALFAATVVVESAFGLRGLGSLLLSSVSQRDFATVQAVTLIMVTAFVVTNLLVDLAQLAVDPVQRLRLAQGPA